MTSKSPLTYTSYSDVKTWATLFEFDPRGNTDDWLYKCYRSVWQLELPFTGVPENSSKYVHLWDPGWAHC